MYLDTKEKQRESVGDYWKGMKEQIGVNTLQDAITAGMYGSQIHDIFSKGKLALGGQPAGMAMPPSAAASRATIQQPNLSGTIFDPTKTQLAGAAPRASSLMAPTADAAGVGSNIMSTTAAPARPYTQGISYSDVSGAEMLPDFDLTELNIDAVKKRYG